MRKTLLASGNARSGSLWDGELVSFEQFVLGSFGRDLVLWYGVHHNTPQRSKNRRELLSEFTAPNLKRKIEQDVLVNSVTSGFMQDLRAHHSI